MGLDFLIILLIIISIFYFQRKFWISRINQFNFGISIYFFDFLFYFHLSLWLVYLFYAFSSQSDSFEHYDRAASAESWNSLWGTGTTFIRYIAYPFVNIFGLSFTSVMLIFSFLGFQGIVLCYWAARENIQSLPVKWLGLSVLELVFLLPNTHFWSSSLGKGSLMVFAIGLVMYGLSRFNKRIIYILIGCFLTYMIRPHILFAIFLGIGVGMMLTAGGIKWYLRLPMMIISLIAIIFLSDDVVEFSGTESINVFSSENLSHRAQELSKGNSGVDISNYNQFMKLFTFLYRPLFIDAPGLLGLITSFENALLLYLTFQMLIYFPSTFSRWNGFFTISLCIFLLVSISLAQVTGNLGIAMRQKAQIMPLFFMLYARILALRQQRNAPSIATSQQFA